MLFMETSERRDGWVLSRLSPIFLMSACTGQVHFGKTMRKAAVGDKKSTISTVILTGLVS